MRRGRYEILISAPDKRFVDRSLGVHGDFDSAMDDMAHYKEMGMGVKIVDLDTGKFISNEEKNEDQKMR